MTKTIVLASLIVLCSCEQTPGDAAPDGAGSDLAAGPDTLALPPESGAAQPLLIPEHVATIEELPGTWYAPFALPGQVAWLSLEGADDAAGATGTYALWRSCGVPTCTSEWGTYHAVPENPAIGFAFIVLDGDGAPAPVAYVIDRLWRDLSGRLAAIEVRRLLATGGFGATTVLWKLPAPGAAASAGSEPALERPAPAPAAAPPALAGVYVRALPAPGDVGALTLGAPAWDGAVATGAYEAAYPFCLPWCFPETGAYALTIASSLTGAGLLELERTGTRTRYAVLALWRNGSGQVTALQLQRLGSVGVAGPPFTMYWQGWTPSDVADAVDGAACAAYQALAGYFHVRALQCAYSPCYPMSPVYGYWSQYYAGLAAAVCEPG